MDEKELMSLGELYRELRAARGLKLRDVVHDGLSVSQLSKFENGKSMLTADKLLTAISGIHMSFSEFGYALNHYRASSYHKIGNQLVTLQIAGDIAGLKDMLKHFEASDYFDTYNRLTRIDIVSAIYSLDSSYEIKEDDKQFLTHYLYGIEQWTEYELYLFGNTMSILSNDDLIFLGKAFAERDEFYLALPQHKKAAQLTFINIILTLIERKQLYYTKYFLNKLESMIDYQDIFTVIFLTFLKDTLAYLKGESDDVMPMRDCIEMVEKLGNSTMAKLLETHLETFLDLYKKD